MILVNRILELLFPRKCVLCSRLLARDETDLCGSCRADAPICQDTSRPIAYLDQWTSVWYYEDHVRDSLLRYKFGGMEHYAKSYGRMLAMKIYEMHLPVTCVTWAPISSRRRLRRGYDQAELLAKAVAKELGLNAVRTLKKVRHNAAQSSITKADRRRANVMGVYGIQNAEQVTGASILLIDDILTTGATISECAKTLRLSGASRVYGATVATGKTQKNR